MTSRRLAVWFVMLSSGATSAVRLIPSGVNSNAQAKISGHRTTSGSGLTTEALETPLPVRE